MRTFIPTAELDPNREYPNYVAVRDGIMHRSVAVQGSRKLGVGYKPGQTVQIPLSEDDLRPRLKRTPRERVASLANRIASQVQKTGLTESVFREIQAEAWKAGNPVTREQVVDLAAIYISRAERDLENEQRKRVTRKNVHMADPGSVITSPASPSTGEG